MARKGQRVFEPVSTPLEDDLSVHYRLVGKKKWFETGFEPGAFDPEQCIVIDDVSDLKPIKDRLWKEKALGCDTETTGPYFSDDKGYSLNPVNDDCRIVTLQLGTEEIVYVIDPELIVEFKDILEATHILHLAHHWLYDFKWLLVKYGVHVMRLYCSMLVEQELTAGLMGYKVGLSDAARRYAPHVIISKAIRSLFIHLNNGLISREMIQYAARDIPLLFPVFREQVKEIDRHKLKKVTQLEFDVVPCTAEMEIGGVYLDQDKLRLLIRYWKLMEEQKGKEILDLYDVRRKQLGGSSFIIPELAEVFDLGSNKEKMEALRQLGIELEDVKRATLMTVNDPLAKMLGEYSAITKRTSTYGSNMLDKINEFTGMWHPRFAQMGSGASEGDAQGRDNKETTATGRYVSDAQQFPRKLELFAVETEPEVKAEVFSRFASEIALAQANLEQEKAA